MLFNLATHNGTVTITSLKTNQHRVITVRTARKGKWAGHRFVSIKCVEADKEHFGDYPYNYFSFGEVVDGKVKVRHQVRDNKFFQQLAAMLNEPQNFEKSAGFQFAGTCIRCNKKLTHPESIRSGIGPDCAKMEGR